MLRRRLPPEPLSVSADWSRRTAIVAALLALSAIPLSRSGAAGGWGGVAVLGTALSLALAALGFAANGMIVIWQTGRRGIGRALVGCAVAALVLAYPVYLGAKAARLPALNDISTDLVAPPPFSGSPAARAARHGVQHEEPSPQAREAQAQAYPAVQPILLDLPAEDAYRLVLKLIASRRWKVVETSSPKGRFGVGHIDAVAGSSVMGFPEDVAIRIRPQEGQTRVDVRSASRLERHDIGDNAARIEALTADLLDAE